MGEYAGRWLRVSTGGQDEANQIPDVNRWIETHDYEVRADYVLHGRSASRGEQQAALDQVLADMRLGLITVLVVWRGDRIERRGSLHMVPLINAVKQAGGRIEFVTQPHLNDLSTMAGRISLAVMAEVAAEETEGKRERSRMTRDRIKAEGGFTGRAVWGYEITGPKYAKTIAPTEQGRALVPQVYARVIAGESLATVARWLEGETGRPWWPRSIGSMIRNPVYRGAQHNASGRVVFRCEALVDAATWRRAGRALDSRPKRGHTDPENRAMLAGVLACPFCADSPMYRLNTGYYRCTGRGANRKGCGNMVAVAAVNATVNRVIAAYFDTPVMAHTVIPGNEAELAAKLESITYDLDQLSKLDLGDDEEDRQRAVLRAQRDQVKVTEIVPDRVELAETGERYAQLWERTPIPGRGEWLIRHGFAVTACKAEVVVAQEEKTARLPLLNATNRTS
jgi:DNA invertase Pin-like site-specific DNA recombinase